MSARDHAHTHNARTREPISRARPDAAPTCDGGCDLCGDPMNPDPDVLDATGLNICPACLEAMIDAPALDARSEVGLVGGRA